MYNDIINTGKMAAGRLREAPVKYFTGVSLATSALYRVVLLQSDIASNSCTS